MIKLVFSIVFIYLVYRFFFDRPLFLRAPGYPPQKEKPQERSNMQDARSGKEDDYIDYEEIE